MPLRCLFIDMNAFFASVEQQHHPEYRGKPVAVIPTHAETTCCIAASYEAKALGIKTGTPVWEARKLGKGRVNFVLANHRQYVLVHNRIIDAVKSIIPVHHISSIDEMSCRLMGEERKPDRAVALATRIKRAIKERAGECLNCSIGIAANAMLAKTASDVQKPDGLTVFSDDVLPEVLHRLKLQDFPGIGPRMTRRLNLGGVFTVRQLRAMSSQALSEVWGSKVLGERWFRMLRGEDVEEQPTRRQTVSHSHILPPSLRNEAGAYGVLVKLSHKATARMRKINFWAGAVSVSVSFQTPSHSDLTGVDLGNDSSPPLPDDLVDEPGFAGPDPSPPPFQSRWSRMQRHWHASSRLPQCQDTPNILRTVASLWQQRPEGIPFKVGMALSDLRPARSSTPSLFEDDRKASVVSEVMDEVNREFGASVVHFGAMIGMKETAPSRVAFTQIPDFDRRVN